MPRFALGVAIGIGTMSLLGGGAYFYFAKGDATSISLPFSFARPNDTKPQGKTPEELVAEAREKSKNVKGLYMTADVAWDPGAGATRIRQNLVRIAEETEINAFVIDVKEACGPDYDEERIRQFLSELHEKQIWAIARIVVMSDSSEINVHPEWYITRKSYKAVPAACSTKRYLVKPPPDGKKPNIVFWQDKAGRYWIDPANKEGRNHIFEFSKKMIDLGFDELQYDYIRFPSDGDIQNAIYPAWDGKTSKCTVMRDYFRFLASNLKAHKPDIILSADLFGYASIGLDTGIGQCVESLENNFDYVSFMVYPSHYYSGFLMPQDPYRNLPPLNYTVAQSRAHPDDIVGRSMLFARDFFDGKISTSTYPFSYITAPVSTSTPPIEPVFVPRSKIRLRPWLEDFFHEADAAAGRPAGAEKARLEIDAAEKTADGGWLLWNAGNVYSEDALKKE